MEECFFIGDHQFVHIIYKGKKKQHLPDGNGPFQQSPAKGEEL